MTVFLPDLYPDELLFSALARYHERRSQSVDATMNQMFGSTSARPLVELPTRLDTLISRLPTWQTYDFNEIIKKHTLFRYRSACWTSEHQDRVKLMMREANHPIAAVARINKGVFQCPEWMIFCPVCVQHDLESVGEPYWHAIHQASGMLTCPDHPETFLLQSSISRRKQISLKDRFVTLKFALSLPVSDLIEDNIKPVCLATIEKITKAIYWIHSNDLSVKNENILQSKYRYLAYKEDIINRNGIININKVAESMNNIFPVELLRAIGMKDEKTGNDRWLFNLLRRNASKSQTIAHVLMMVWLGIDISLLFQESEEPDLSLHPFGPGPWDCMNPFANHDKKNAITLPPYDNGYGYSYIFVCKYCGYSYKIGKLRKFDHIHLYEPGKVWDEEVRKLSSDKKVTLPEVLEKAGITKYIFQKHARRLSLSRWSGKVKQRPLVVSRVQTFRRLQREYRSELLFLVKTKKNLSRKDLAVKLMSKGYMWLIRNDREWFDSHAPRFIGINRTKWSIGVLAEYDGEITTYINSIRNVLLKPSSTSGKIEQITFNSVARLAAKHMGVNGFLTPLHDGRLPNSRNLIMSIVESKAEYYERKIKYIARVNPKGIPINTHKQLLVAANIAVKTASPRLIDLSQRLITEILQKSNHE